jgi:hypothetical protein
MRLSRRLRSGASRGVRARWRRMIIGACGVVLATAAHAQPVVTPGARIRLVQVDSGRVDYVGRFMRRSGDTLTLQLESALVRTVAMSRYRVELGGGRHRHVLAGTLIGATVGMGVGVLLDSGSDDCILPRSDGTCASRRVQNSLSMVGLVLTSFAGGVVGGLVGMVPHEEWTAAVFLPQVEVAPARGVWRVGFSLTF